ncbi:MAG: ComEA family DNA-binding protein [Pseudomonadales bacterium]
MNTAKWIKRISLAFVVALLPATFSYANPTESSAVAAVVQFEKINVNNADAEMLTALNGVGSVKAQSIVEYRNQNGRFKTAEDLLAVDGIGQATVAKNKDRIVVD